MALNIRTAIEKKTSSNTMSQNFMAKNHITVNEPAQAHFSVEGVQTYSPQEIRALKIREERVKLDSIKDGIFVPLQIYAIDSAIQFIDTAPPNEKSGFLKAKTKKPLQPVKPNVESKSHKIIKPSIRNTLGRANQKMVKLQKEQRKQQKLQQQLQELKKKYKTHFGDDIKSNKKNKKDEERFKEQQEQEKEQELSNRQEQSQEEQQFMEKQQDGDQCAPQHSIKQAKTKATKPAEKAMDDSFQEVDWETGSKPSSSRLKLSTYSERLGNAVNSLFD